MYVEKFYTFGVGCVAVNATLCISAYIDHGMEIADLTSKYNKKCISD